MEETSGKLTVYFEEPFWVGVFERISDGRLSVCRIVFGAEPKDYEIKDFILKHYYELKVVSDHIFVKTKSNALTSENFAEFIVAQNINEFFVVGADATACVKSTCYNMKKAGYAVHVISDGITSYDLKKIDDMLTYYASKGCEVRTLAEYMKKD